MEGVIESENAKTRVQPIMSKMKRPRDSIGVLFNGIIFIMKRPL
jgi:hypothetical protein